MNLIIIQQCPKFELAHWCLYNSSLRREVEEVGDANGKVAGILGSGPTTEQFGGYLWFGRDLTKSSMLTKITPLNNIYQ